MAKLYYATNLGGPPPDTDPPVLQTATANGTAFALTYDESLDEASVPATGAYSLANSGAAQTVSSVDVDGLVVNLVASPGLSSGDVCTINYTAGANPVRDLAGNLAANLTNQAVTNNTPDTVSPALQTATVNATLLDLTYDEALDETSVPVPGDYDINEPPGNPQTVASVAISGAVVTLTLSPGVDDMDTIAVSYTAGANPVRDLALNLAANLVNQFVTNNTPDTTGPILDLATINGVNLALQYNEALDETSVPVPGDYSVGNSGAAQSVSSVDVSGVYVNMVVSPGVAEGDTVDVDYTSGANPVRDLATNPAANLVNEPVTNNTSSSTPELPQSEPDVSLPTGWDGPADSTPANAAELAAALVDVSANNRQNNGGVPWIIELTAGNDYQGEFDILPGGGDDWLIIRTSAYATLPPPGVRVTDATGMAKLWDDSWSPVIMSVQSGTANIRFIGIEFSLEHVNTADEKLNYAFIRNKEAANIIYDRVYVHSMDDMNTFDAMLFDECPGDIAVVDSRISGIQTHGQSGAQGECHAIFLSQCTGSNLVQNCYLEAGGENFLTVTSGGPHDPATLTQDITFRGNYCFKPESWRNPPSSGFNAGKPRACKNLFETKEATRMLIEGNKFENCWPAEGSQFGVAIVLKSDSGHSSNITVRNNVFIDADRAITITGKNGTENVLFENNLWILSSSSGTPTASGRSILISDSGVGESNLIWRNNTLYDPTTSGTELIYFGHSGTYIDGFIWKNNIFSSGNKIQKPSWENDVTAIRDTCTNIEVDTNLVRGRSTPYAADPDIVNWIYADDDAEIQYSNGSGTMLEIGDFVLLPTSPGYQAGLDGKDVGCDIAQLQAALND